MMKKALIILFSLLNGYVALSQRPENYPAADQGPPEITLINVLLYFVFPVLIVAIYFWSKMNAVRKKSRQTREKKLE